MSIAVDDITDVALTMSVSQRAALANTLLASLDDSADSPTDVHTAWTTEIRSRVDDLVTGRVKTIPREQVDARIAATLAARHR